MTWENFNWSNKPQPASISLGPNIMGTSTEFDLFDNPAYTPDVGGGTIKLNSPPSNFGWGDFSNLMSGVGSLGGAITGWNTYKLNKENIRDQMGLNRANYQNQAALTNMKLEERAKRSAALAGREYDPSNTLRLRENY
jgi:hypothetical protein